MRDATKITNTGDPEGWSEVDNQIARNCKLVLAAPIILVYVSPGACSQVYRLSLGP